MHTVHRVISPPSWKHVDHDQNKPVSCHVQLSRQQLSSFATGPASKGGPTLQYSRWVGRVKGVLIAMQ